MVKNYKDHNDKVLQMMSQKRQTIDSQFNSRKEALERLAKLKALSLEKGIFVYRLLSYGNVEWHCCHKCYGNGKHKSKNDNLFCRHFFQIRCGNERIIFIL